MGGSAGGRCRPGPGRSARGDDPGTGHPVMKAVQLELDFRFESSAHDLKCSGQELLPRSGLATLWPRAPWRDAGLGAWLGQGKHPTTPLPCGNVISVGRA